jgi:hypothetical protein
MTVLMIVLGVFSLMVLTGAVVGGSVTTLG